MYYLQLVFLPNHYIWVLTLNKLPVTMGIRAQKPKIITISLTESAQFLIKAVHPNQGELVA